MKNVLYVPLDDRPVNLDDVIIQGQSAGINVITPSIADIKNRLDSAVNSTVSPISTHSPTFGNSANIKQFILDNAASADGFILSTDMLAYGGLIGSRRLRTSPGGTYPSYDSVTTNLLDVIRLVKQSYPSKPIFVLDTVMRLATTVLCDGLSQTTYNSCRDLMMQPRKTASSFTSILSGYDLKPDGTNYGAVSGMDKTQYYNTRQHKFKSNYYVLDQLARLGYIDFLAIGVDDAASDGVQVNEINFIKNYINASLGGSSGQNPNKAIIMPDADGLGQALMGRMANQLLRGGAKPTFSIQYFGSSGTATNPYEYMTIDENLRRHIDVVGGQYVASSAMIEIVAITNSANVSSAVSKIAANGANRIPTIVIDFVDFYTADATVTDALTASQFMGRVLGYSAWNTYGNRIGIALGMGQARYAFLVTETQAAALSTAVNAHGSLLFKRFLKDYYYKKIVAPNDIRAYSDPRPKYSNPPAGTVPSQHMRLLNTDSDYTHLQTVLRNRMQTYASTLAARSCFLIGSSTLAYNVKQIGTSWTFASYNTASLVYGNPDFIWNRAFEITLKPDVTLS